MSKRNKDLSKNDIKNKITIKNDFFYNNFPLDNCNKKEINIDLSNNIKNNLNINLDNFNMTIKKLVDCIDKNRKKNEQQKTNENKNPDKNKKSIIIDKLDEKYNDISNSQIICYEKNNYNLKQNLFAIDKQYDFIVNKRNTFDNSSIYYNQNKFIENIQKKYTLPPPNPIIEFKREKVNIQVEINDIGDILNLIEKYPLKINVEYNIDMKSMHAIKEPLYELNKMIGMQNLKKSIVDQILFFVQNLHINNDKQNNDFMHTCIYGPPGTGKTELAKLIGKIFSKMGILKKNIFKKATRSDLIAGYLGQTALKTKTLINECLGGVLFIDEAYSLGNQQKRDSFAKECIDTLCECLSDHKSDLMVIIAGYKEELTNCFFNYNKGLDSRFTWRFKTDEYTPSELRLIFIKKIQDINWKFDDKIKDEWFEEKKNYFKYFGRDMETLLAKVKIAHSKRVFCLEQNQKKIINLKDMEKGFELFLQNDEVKQRNEKPFSHHMYV